MKQNHVNFSDTDAEHTNNYRNRLHPGVSNIFQPFLIGDIRFLIVLLQTFATPQAAGWYPEMWFPEDMKHLLPEKWKIKLDLWVQEGVIKLSETDEDIFNEIFALKRHPGLHFSEYISILTAHKRQMQIISCSQCITQESARFKLIVTDGEKLVQLMQKGITLTGEELKKNKMKNPIFFYGVPASIAGNF